MKSILKTLFLFLAFIFTLSLTPQGESFCDSQYIQNDYQKIAIVSNTMRGGEIVADKGNNSASGSLNNQIASNIFFDNNLFSKTPTLIQGKFIHNLSTNIDTEISIRAP